MGRSLKGQMSLIMMLVIAGALVFYGVAQNWSKISTYKTQVTLASNTGAATLVSMVASYGENLLQTQLGGKLSRTEATGTAVDIIVMCATIVFATLLCIFAPPLGVPLLTLTIVSMSVGVAMSVTAVVVDVALIQPGLTKAWSKAVSEIGNLEDQFVAQGLQGMLAGVVNDTVNVADRWDMDMDGRWYDPLTGKGNDPQAKVARFSYYYSNQLNSVITEDTPMQALKLILAQMQDQLGLMKPGTGNVCDDTKPQCNPECQPHKVLPPEFDYSTGHFIVPDLTQCGGDQNPACDPRRSAIACYAFDPLYEKLGVIPEDAPKNLMFTLGHDDPDPLRRGWQNWLETDPFVTIMDPLFTEWGPLDGGVFRATDAQGELFPFLWLVADVGVKGLTEQTTGTTYPGCIWRAGADACKDEVAYNEPPLTGDYPLGAAYYRPSAAYERLALPNGCYENDCRINQFRNSLSNYASLDPREIDNVLPGSMVPESNENEINPVFWKKGWEGITQTYDEEHTVPGGELQTEKYTIPRPFKESRSNTIIRFPPRWRTDPLDRFVDHLSAFSRAALAITTSSDIGAAQIAGFIDMWGDQLQQLTIDLDLYSGSILDPETNHSITNEIDRWLQDTAGQNVTNTVNGELWCLPEENDPLMHPAERVAILDEDPVGFPGPDPSLNGGAITWGSLTSVINCAQYNSLNAEKFQACLDNCPSGCAELPRSLKPGFDPNAFLSCDPENKYLSFISESMALAINQSAKFAKRTAHLTDLRDRAIRIRNSFAYAHHYLSTPLDRNDPDPARSPKDSEILLAAKDFLTDPNALYTPTELIRELLVHLRTFPTLESPARSNEIIYGWFSKKPEGSTLPYGSFHAVKVLASIPQKRGEYDGYHVKLPFPGRGDPNQNKLPNIHTTSSLTDRTYSLVDRANYVGARVIRYDQDNDTALNFLSGLPLWKFKYGYPQGTALPADLIASVHEKCTKHFVKMKPAGQPVQYTPDIVADGDPDLREAFMMEVPTTSPEQSECLSLVEHLLRRGVVSETCAYYDAVPNTNVNYPEPEHKADYTYDMHFTSCR